MFVRNIKKLFMEMGLEISIIYKLKLEVKYLSVNFCLFLGVGIDFDRSLD